LYHSS